MQCIKEKRNCSCTEQWTEPPVQHKIIQVHFTCLKAMPAEPMKQLRSPCVQQWFAKQLWQQKEQQMFKEDEVTKHMLKHQETVKLKHIWMQIKLAFGFIASPLLSTNHNAFLILSHMPAWYYFDQPSHLAFHDLTSYITPPKNLCSLLGLWLKFCPTPRYTTSNLQPTLDQFKRDL